MSSMKIKPYQKGIAFGIITALVTISLVSGVYYGMTSISNNNLLPPFEWDFSSLDALSLQISERSDYLLAFTTETVRLSEGWDGMNIPYFNYSVYSIHSYYITEDETQILHIGDYLDNETDYETYYTIQSEQLVPFSLALAKDLQTMENYTDIANNYWEEMDAVLVPGAFSIWIEHVYQDGSYIKIQSVGNTVFIRYARFKEYHGELNHWGIIDLDIEEFEDGRDKYKEFYKATIPQIFTNHTIAVNEFLEQFY
ncbi:MAG: hypothetical protein H7644_06780 [Candidatus Heimdallarchaeota archaeon]|nr:hypothetical protein [Candidatus Heimdallarchaeota archaeon]MCK5143453.1 hypothetical protein [Candidatus Heimdallarchaeota archaeon]